MIGQFVAIGRAGPKCTLLSEGCRKIGDQIGDLVPATRAAGSLGPLGTPTPLGACNDLERAKEQSQRDVSVYEGAFPIGDEILLHWVSAGTEGKEVLLYLAALAFLGHPGVYR